MQKSHIGSSLSTKIEHVLHELDDFLNSELLIRIRKELMFIM